MKSRITSSSKIEPTTVRKSNQQQFENRTDKNVTSFGTIEVQTSLNKDLNKKTKKNINKSIDQEQIIEIDDSSSKKNLYAKEPDRLIDNNQLVIKYDQQNLEIEDSTAQFESAIPKIKELAIYLKEVEKLEAAVPIKKMLLQKIDRLLDDNIRLEDIVVVYQSYKERSNYSDTFDSYFADVLERVLTKTKGKIRNIKDLIHVTIQNDYQPKDKLSTPDKPLSESEIRKRRILGQWDNDPAFKRQEDHDDNLSEEELEALREETKRAIQELLES